MARIQQITGVGYSVDVIWVCQIDRDILPQHSELKQHTIFQHTTLNTRDALQGCRTKAMILHYAISEKETIRYCNIMSLYPFVCKYSKFPIGHFEVQLGDACWDIRAILCKVGLTKCTV